MKKNFDWVRFLAQGCGSGLLTPAPGTWGSLLAVLLYAPLTFLPKSLLLPFLLLAFLLGIYVCGQTAKRLGDRDPGSIVWDEMVAVWLVLAFLPPYLVLSKGMMTAWAVAFVLFRVFDIWKPFPIAQLEKRFGGGFGIMLDDLIAAIYTLLLLYAWTLLLRSWHVLWLLALVVLVIVVYRNSHRLLRNKKVSAAAAHQENKDEH